MTSLVEFSDVSVNYGSHDVVSDVSFAVPAGQWLGILGPNGAGKSSLLRTAVGGTLTRGSVTVEGEDVRSLSGKARANLVAYVPQRPIFPTGMAVFDYVLLGRTPHMGRLAAESSDDVEIVWDALTDLDLNTMADRDVASLSGGETQRLSMARVIAQRAPVLILDEATAALDVARQHQVLELIDDVRTRWDLAVISAMHDLTAAAQFCDAVMVIDDGVSRGIGAPEVVLTEPLLQQVFEPSVRVLEVEGSKVIISMRQKEQA
ncbi:MAG: ABC transporter ATP-binding protein [Acidimicrobiia bacterium]